MLLPGTACTWQLNFKNVVDDLAERYHIIAVNYDGFEGDPNVLFTDVPTVTRKIEDHLLKNHGGRATDSSASSIPASFTPARGIPAKPFCMSAARPATGK